MDLKNLLPDSNFGGVPQNAKNEMTYSVLQDTVFYAPGATLGQKSLFAMTESKTSQYRNAIISDIAQKKNIAFQSIYATHTFQFAARGSEDATLTAWYFHNFSYFNLKKMDKVYDKIPLAFVLPFDICQIGATVTVIERTNPFFRLSEPIKIPVGGNLEIDFMPASGLTTAASGATNPQLPGLGLSNDYGFSLSVFLNGSQWRSVA